MNTRRLVLGAFVVLGLCLAWQLYQRGRAEREVFGMWVDHQRAELDAAGWERAEHASQNQIAATVMTLSKEIDAAREAGARIAVASHWEGQGKPTWIPCGEAAPGEQPGERGENGLGAAAEDPPADRATAAAPTRPGAWPVQHVLIEDAVVLNDAGEIYVKRNVQGRLSVGKDWYSAWEEIVPIPGNKTKVDPAIEAAWAAAKNPPPKVAIFRKPKEWRLGLSCGIGGGYTLIGARADGFAGCLYGGQF